MDDSTKKVLRSNQKENLTFGNAQTGKSSNEEKTTSKKEDSAQQITTGQQETAQQPEQSKANVGKHRLMDDSVRSTSKQPEEASYLRSDSQSSIEKTLLKRRIQPNK